jgi:hypothetical protein
MINISVKNKGKVDFDPSKYLTIENQILKDIDFSGKKLMKFCSINSRFENCKFENMRINNFCPGSGLQVSEYINCSFDGTKLKSVIPGCARFINCSFRNTVINDMFCFETDFINCVFSGKMKGVVINGSVRRENSLKLGKVKNEIYGNDFSEVEMDDVGFRTGVDLTKQKLPISENYLYLESPTAILIRAKELISQWSESEKKRIALVTIKAKEGTISKGQNQIFIIKGDIREDLFNILKMLCTN